MKLLPFRFLAATLALTSVATPLVSAAYDPAVVSADARWVLHADFAALRASQLGQELISSVEKAQQGANGGIIGINVPKLFATLGRITAYGANLSADPAALDGTLIAQGTADLRKIAESLLLQGTLAEPQAFAEITDLPFPAYAITGKDKDADASPVYVAFPPEPVIIASKSKAQLTKARDVVRGSAPSLAKVNKSPLNQLAANTPGAYFFAASVVPADPIFPEKAPQTRILQLVESGAVAVGERGPDAFGYAELVASSDRNADKLAKILEGMTAVLGLAESNDRQLAHFLESTRVTRQDERVTVNLTYPAARLVEMTHALREQATAQPTRNRKAPITMGRVLAEWTAADADPTDGLQWRTIDSVSLTNGSLITLGRALSGGRDAAFERVEISPVANAGASTPLVFGREFMRSVRGTMWQFPFPGADGTYTVRVAYRNDPEGKTRFAVSTHDPRATPADGK